MRLTTSSFGPSKAEVSTRAQNVADDPGCVKTLSGITAPGISGSTVIRGAKKRKNLSSARHYDQIGFRFHTAKTRFRHRPVRRTRLSRRRWSLLTRD